MLWSQPNSQGVRNGAPSTTKTLSHHNFLKVVYMTLAGFILPYLNNYLFKYKYHIITDLEIYIKLIVVYFIYGQKYVSGEMHYQKYNSLIDMIQLL